MLLTFPNIHTFFFQVYFLGLFAFNVQVSRERQETGGREGAMTCRIGFKPGSPAVRTVASTHGAGALPALPTELKTTLHLYIFTLLSLKCLDTVVSVGNRVQTSPIESHQEGRLTSSIQLD